MLFYKEKLRSSEDYGSSTAREVFLADKTSVILEIVSQLISKTLKDRGGVCIIHPLDSLVICQNGN
jgi:hypothetical protein